MSSIAKPIKRSKETRHLGRAQDIRPENQYEAFDMDTKVECLLGALILLGPLLRSFSNGCCIGFPIGKDGVVISMDEKGRWVDNVFVE